MSQKTLITRRRFFQITSSAALGVIGTGLYTWQLEPHWVEFVEKALPVANLPSGLAGKKLVQLSDLHIGPRVSDDYLLTTFERVNRLSPEFIVYTGDFSNHDAESFSQIREMFQHLPLGKLGTYGVLGNHDYGPDWDHPETADRITELAQEAGVTILRNEMAEAEGLQIAGMDDPWANRFDARKGLAGLHPEKAALVLSHNPDTADEPVWEGFSGWILAGHTHGGQCKPPFLPPPLLPVRNRRYTSGEFFLDGNRRMYISRGVGHLLQVRFNVRPEVTVFTLSRA